MCGWKELVKKPIWQKDWPIQTPLSLACHILVKIAYPFSGLINEVCDLWIIIVQVGDGVHQ